MAIWPIMCCRLSITVVFTPPSSMQSLISLYHDCFCFTFSFLGRLTRIETHNNIRTVHSDSSGVKLTRFEIEGWLELIGTPSVDILHQSDCA